MMNKGEDFKLISQKEAADMLRQLADSLENGDKNVLLISKTAMDVDPEVINASCEEGILLVSKAISIMYYKGFINQFDLYTRKIKLMKPQKKLMKEANEPTVTIMFPDISILD